MIWWIQIKGNAEIILSKGISLKVRPTLELSNKQMSACYHVKLNLWAFCHASVSSKATLLSYLSQTKWYSCWQHNPPRNPPCIVWHIMVGCLNPLQYKNTILIFLVEALFVFFYIMTTGVPFLKPCSLVNIGSWVQALVKIASLLVCRLWLQCGNGHGNACIWEILFKSDAQGTLQCLCGFTQASNVFLFGERVE